MAGVMASGPTGSSAPTCTARWSIRRCAPKCLASTRRRRSAKPENINAWRPGLPATPATWINSACDMNWELLLEQLTFDLRRSGRFLVADLKVPHHVLSTSVRHGGQVDYLRHLLNHQSCEG